MRRGLAAAVIVVLCLTSAVGGGAAAESPGFGALQTGDVTADQVVLHADVQADGDAVWTIEYRVRLQTQNETEAFRSLEADIRNNSSAYTDQFARRMRSTVAAAENATGRQMAVANVSVTAEIRQLPQGRYGVVTYQFVWQGFAATPGERIEIGDALSGFFLDENSRLIVSWPDDYEVRQVVPEPSDRSPTSVTWNGPADFTGDQPRLVLAPASTLPVSTPIVVGLVLVVLGAGGGIWWWRSRAGASGSPTPPAPEPSAEPHHEAEETGEPPQPGPADAAGAAGATAADSGESPEGAEGEATGEAAEPSEPPEELLSPEERVLRLLRERGGRMKQKEVTEELGWSAARTSQVVGDLRDEGDVESFRLGRENVLKLPEEPEEQ